MTGEDQFVLLPTAPSTLSIANASSMNGLQDDESASEVFAQVSVPKMHHSLVIAMSLERALAVAQAEQQLTRARTIRAQQVIFENIVGSSDPLCTDQKASVEADDLKNAFAEIIIKTKTIEARHEELKAARDVSMQAVHRLISRSLQRGSAQMKALLQAVVSWPDEKINSVRFDDEVDPPERVETAFAERQGILGDVSMARVIFLDVYDRLCSLCDVVAIFARRDKAIMKELAKMRDKITSFLAEVDKQLGLDASSRKKLLLKLARTELAATQKDACTTQNGEICSPADDLALVNDGKMHELLTISKSIAARNSQIDDLVSALKITDEALFLRMTASAVLNAEEKNAIIEGKKRALLLFQSMDDLEKSMTNRNVKIGTEDMLRHILKVAECAARLVNSNEIVREILHSLWDTVLLNYGAETARSMMETKKLFKLKDCIPNRQDVAFATHVLPFNGGPRNEQYFSFKFSAPAGDAQVLTLFKKLDTEASEPVRITSECTNDREVFVKTWGLNHILSFDVSIVAISANDGRFQTGSCWFHTGSEWAPNPLKPEEHISSTAVTFDRPFGNNPSVRLFVSYLDAGREPIGDLSTTSWVDNITPFGFRLCTKVWNGRTDLLGLTLRWIAHDPDETTIRSGVIQHDSETWAQSKKGTIRFDEAFADCAPSVLVTGIAGMECNFGKQNLRFQIQESDVGPEGFNYVAGPWHTSRMKHGRWSWIAIE
ncbi:unnamed protein product [Tilletia controversa]|nr:unnamed protein product [Tilletia controversa]